MTPELINLRDAFALESLREHRNLDLKLRSDTQRCFLPSAYREPSCSHENCRYLRNAEIGADFAQFANADGGILLYGVREAHPVPQLAGIADPSTERRSIEHAVTATCRPSPTFASLEFTAGARSLLAFHIFPSTIPVWTLGLRGTLKIVRRIDETKVNLGPEQTLEFVTDMSRSNRIRLRALFNDQNVSNHLELAGGVVQTYDDLVNSGGGYGAGHPPSHFRVALEHVHIMCCDDDEFEVEFARQGATARERVRLPYSAVLHVWRTANNRLGLVLSVRLLLVDNLIVVA